MANVNITLTNGMNAKLKSKYFKYIPNLFKIINFNNFDSTIYRMKEFERERRLLQREHRKKLAAEKESLNDLA